ncbi:hypothetical protein [Embleya sp. NPDC059237]|uniref:hypothetical protein n=1 Tax=Embleya sp. NPDC059237 TaxID=3346784 RepID=UPI0036C62EEA
MGIFNSAYFAYGSPIPTTGEELLEEVLQARPEIEPNRVGYLRAGTYDRDMTFLVTECVEADLGKYERVTPQAFDRGRTTAWDQSIRAAAAELGHTNIPDPGWFVVPDQS